MFLVRHISVQNRLDPTLDLPMPSWIGSPKLIPRVLDVDKGQLCLIIGTVYMDMPLKPNILENIGRDVSRDPFRNIAFASYLVILRSIPFQHHHRQRKYTRGMIGSCLKMNRVESG